MGRRDARAKQWVIRTDRLAPIPSKKFATRRLGHGQDTSVPLLMRRSRRCFRSIPVVVSTQLFASPLRRLLLAVLISCPSPTRQNCSPTAARTDTDKAGTSIHQVASSPIAKRPASTRFFPQSSGRIRTYPSLSARPYPPARYRLRRSWRRTSWKLFAALYLVGQVDDLPSHPSLSARTPKSSRSRPQQANLTKKHPRSRLRP